MGRITAGIGLISNINHTEIIDQLMKLEARPKDKLQERIDKAKDQKLAYADLSTRLTGLKLTATTLKKPSTFRAATATSSDDNVLTATAANGASIGNYQFQVARMVTTQQTVSGGFADFNSTPVGAGTITIEQGGGELSTETLLSRLNGGAGVRRGMFRITDRSGATAVIDATASVSLDDVVKKINTSLAINVRASVDGDRLVLTDLTGKAASNLLVADLADGKTATDLGIAADESSDTITGGDINYVGAQTLLDQLNDGRGVRTTGGGTADFRVTARDGTSFDVTLGAAKTVGQVIDAINAASGGKVRAQIDPGSNGIRLSNTAGGTGAFSVTALNGSGAAADLGIATSTNTNVIAGDPVLAGINTVLVSSLRGGSGLPHGRISITDRAGGTATIDLSGAKSVQEILDRISNNSGVEVTASLKASGNGIQITDDSGDTGNLVISDVTGTSAATLGIAGTFAPTVTAVQGANLQRQWVSRNSLLADYNGGKGITPGRFKIKNSNGLTATIDLSDPTVIKLGQVIDKINAAGIGVTASVNANGDGLLLTDTTAGAGKLAVEEVDSTTAAALNIKGEAAAAGAAGRIDGSFEKTITVSATDTLADVQKKITDLGFGVSASIINDGTGLAPYRLSMTAKNSGRDGRIVFDAGATSLGTRDLVGAQDAAVFLGSAGVEQPLLITAGQNQITGVIQGVTIELHGVSDKPVTLGVARSADKLVEDLTKFADGFNELADKLKELTKFDPDTKERGLLLGESAVQTVETLTYSMFGNAVKNSGRFRVLADVGLRLGDGGKVEFDETKFREAYAADPQSVEDLFAASTTATDNTVTPPKQTITGVGIGWLMEQSFTRLIDPVDGVITRENKTLDSKTNDFQGRIDALDKILEQKRARLERQFAQMETVLAGLQSQQQALGALQNLPVPSSSSSNK
jgi:flagellar hook-associated protein 2